MESKIEKHSTKWLNRTLVFGPHLCLCFSDEEAKAAAKVLNYDYNDVTHAGRCFVLQKQKEITCIIILANLVGKDIESALGLIVHESVHVKQQFLESIGEDKPSTEFEAYMLQNISQTLIEELYDRVVIKKKKIVRIKMGCKSKKPPKK